MVEIIRDSDWMLYIHEAELSPKTENWGSLSTHTLSPVDGIMITWSLVRTRALVLAVIWQIVTKVAARKSSWLWLKVTKNGMINIAGLVSISFISKCVLKHQNFPNMLSLIDSDLQRFWKTSEKHLLHAALSTSSWRARPQGTKTYIVMLFLGDFKELIQKISVWLLSRETILLLVCYSY